MALARTATAAIVFGVLAFAGAGAMLGPADAGSAQFEERWGDLNCEGAPDSIDALLVLTHIAGGFVYVPEGICWPDAYLFQDTVVHLEGGRLVHWADVDCDGKIWSVDALWILRDAVGLDVPGFAGCPEIGVMTTLFTEADGPGAFVAQWGNVDCNGTLDGIDGLKVLRYVAGYRVYQGAPCWYPDTLVQIKDGPQVQWADLDCDGKISPVDALPVLRYVSGYQVAPVTGCPDLGAEVVFSFPPSR